MPRRIKQFRLNKTIGLGDTEELERKAKAKQVLASVNRRRHITRFYDSRQWRRVRLIQLAKEPLCRACKSMGVITSGVVADHIVPISQGGERFDMDNLQSLCTPCHNRKTGQEMDRAGLGRDRADRIL